MVNEDYSEGALLNKYRAEVSELRAQLQAYEQRTSKGVTSERTAPASDEQFRGAMAHIAHLRSSMSSLRKVVLLACPALKQSQARPTLALAMEQVANFIKLLWL
jgi:hypothetical protein